MKLYSVLLSLAALVLLAEGFLTGGAATAVQPAETVPAAKVETAPLTTEEIPTGWQEENGRRFFLKDDGSRATGWLDADGQRYYLDGDGAAYTGWQTIDGQPYYFRADGTMARGRVEIDGVNHFFTADGTEILLTNPWNPMPEGYVPELTDLDTYYGTAGLQVDPVCLEDLIAMIDACNAAGSRAYVLSAYRSFEQQQTLFDRKVKSLMANGASRADAEAEAATVVLLPGTSEHHLGLAVDIIDTALWALDERQADLPAQQWLMENCWQYGFILRYPQDKTAVTGIIYEPWHYRYVGADLAAELHETGLTLEEYMDSLS